MSNLGFISNLVLALTFSLRAAIISMPKFDISIKKKMKLQQGVKFGIFWRMPNFGTFRVSLIGNVNAWQSVFGWGMLKKRSYIHIGSISNEKCQCQCEFWHEC